MKLYVAGPMTGYPGLNYSAFRIAGEELKMVGYHVYNPIDVDEMHAIETKDPWSPDLKCRSCEDGQRHTWEWYMKRCVKMLTDADGVATLDGWYKSRGARVEVSLAKIIDMPVATTDEWIARRLESDAQTMA